MFKHAEIALAPSQCVATNDDLYLAVAVHGNTCLLYTSDAADE